MNGRRALDGEGKRRRRPLGADGLVDGQQRNVVGAHLEVVERHLGRLERAVGVLPHAHSHSLSARPLDPAVWVTRMAAPAIAARVRTPNFFLLSIPRLLSARPGFSEPFHSVRGESNRPNGLRNSRGPAAVHTLTVSAPLPPAAYSFRNQFRTWFNSAPADGRRTPGWRYHGHLALPPQARAVAPGGPARLHALRTLDGELLRHPVPGQGLRSPANLRPALPRDCTGAGVGSPSGHGRGTVRPAARAARAPRWNRTAFARL